MLTARGEETDRIRGISVGADDYVVKPKKSPGLIDRAPRCDGLPLSHGQEARSGSPYWGAKIGRRRILHAINMKAVIQ